MAIEAIWGDLLTSSEQIHSPSWHLEALKETEARVAADLEEPMDWEQAKAKLRKDRRKKVRLAQKPKLI